MLIKDLITDNTNIIEFHLMSIESNLFLDNSKLNKIKSLFKKTKEYNMVLYCRNNYNYLYDLSNDNQCVFIRKLENSLIYNNYYILVLNEIKLPTHTFACTNDINQKYNFNIIEFKINNRITLIIKNNNCYITYKHNKDVDIDKIQETLNVIINKLRHILI